VSLDKCDLFQGMSEQGRAQIATIAVAESHPQGTVLFRENDAANHLYILCAGHVRLTWGQRGLMARLLTSPGEEFGWASVAGHETYTATAECVFPTKVLKIDKMRMGQLLEQDPVSGLQFYRRLAYLVGRRLMDCYAAMSPLHGEGNTRSYG
jgi:CRP-like cAMP-binding protein